MVGEYFYSEKSIWDDPYDLWPHRIPTRPIVYIDNCDDGVYIKDIWDNLSFIKTKNKWGSQVQGSFRRLGENDYNVIINAINEKKRSL